MQIFAVSNYFKTNLITTPKSQARPVFRGEPQEDSFEKTKPQEAIGLYWKIEKIARSIGYAASRDVEAIGKNKVSYERDASGKATKIIVYNESGVPKITAEVEYQKGKKLIKTEQKIGGMPTLIVCDGEETIWSPNTQVRVLQGFSREGDVLTAKKCCLYNFAISKKGECVSEHIKRLEAGEHVAEYCENARFSGSQKML